MKKRKCDLWNLKRLILMLIIFQLKFISLAQKPIFNINYLKEQPLVSYQAEARSSGLQKYTYGNIPDSINPQNVLWLDIDSKVMITPEIERYSNVRYLKLLVFSDTSDLSFLKAFKKIEIMELGCISSVPVEISDLKNLSALKIITGPGDIDFENLKNLPRLKLLYLEEGEFKKIPPHLSTMDSLYHFALFNVRNRHKYDDYYQAFGTITDWSGLENNKTIEKITIMRCGLTFIPPQLSTCSSLDKLLLEENLLSDFTNFETLKQIRTLSLKSSLPNIQQLPEELLGLEQLLDLNLRQFYNNVLNCNGIVRLRSLEKLTCNPKIESDDNSFSIELLNLNNLKKLYCTKRIISKEVIDSLEVKGVEISYL